MSKASDQLRPVLLPRTWTGLTGGGATKLDGWATTTISTSAPQTFVMFTIAGVLYVYRLDAGTDAESSPNIIRPDDYATTTNEKVWRMITALSPGTFTGFANPSASVGLTAVNGSATTAMRSDGAPALDVTIAPTWTGKHIIRKTTTPFELQYDASNGCTFTPDLSGNMVVATTGQFFSIGTSTDFTVDKTNHRVGIGTAAPSSPLTVVSTANTAEFFRYSTNAAQPAGFQLKKANGSIASPSVIIAGDHLGRIQANGYDGASFITAGTIILLADPNGTVTTGIVPGAMTFNVLPNGGSVLVEAMRINMAGNVGIGNASPGARLDILSTTDQVWMRYDTSNYVKHVVDSSGNYAITTSNVGSLVSVTALNFTLNQPSSNTGAAFYFNSRGSGVARFRLNTLDAGTVQWALRDDAAGADRLNLNSSGNIGIGTGTSFNAGKLEVLSTTQQLGLSYDSTHRLNVTVDSSGNSTFTSTGGTSLTISDKLILSSSQVVPSTITAPGTTTTQTINKMAGRVNIAASGTTVTVNNSLVTANSIVIPVLASNDTTAKIKNCVPGSGSFVVTLDAAATAEVAISFLVLN